MRRSLSVLGTLSTSGVRHSALGSVCASSLKRNVAFKVQFRQFTRSSAAEANSESRLCTDELDKPSQKVLDIADEIVSLNLLEINQFLRYLQKRMGVPEAFYENGFSSVGGGGGGGGGGAAASGAAAAAEAPKAKEAFDLKLTEVPAASKIKIIKEIRAITGLGLKEAKEMVENSPVVVKQGLKKEEAEKLKATIVEAGGKAELL